MGAGNVCVVFEVHDAQTAALSRMVFEIIKKNWKPPAEMDDIRQVSILILYVCDGVLRSVLGHGNCVSSQTWHSKRLARSRQRPLQNYFNAP